MRALRLWAAAAAAPVVAAGFYALAVLRRRRSLHPTAIGYQGWLQVPNERSARRGVPLFQAGATHPALLRFSRGAGLPEPLPDALGVAIKLPDAHGPGVDQDLLLTSSTDRPLLRRLLFPATSFVRGAFSTAPPYDLGSNGSCCYWSQCSPVTCGPPAVRATVLAALWLNCVPSPPAAWSWSCEPPSPSAAPSRWPP